MFQPRPIHGDKMPRGWKRHLYHVPGDVINCRVASVGHLWWKKPVVEIRIRLDLSGAPAGLQRVPALTQLPDEMVPHPQEITVQMAPFDAVQFPVGAQLDLELGVAGLTDQWLYGMEPIQVVKINGQLPTFQ